MKTINYTNTCFLSIIITTTMTASNADLGLKKLFGNNKGSDEITQCLSESEFLSDDYMYPELFEANSLYAESQQLDEDQSLGKTHIYHSEDEKEIYKLACLNVTTTKPSGGAYFLEFPETTLSCTSSSSGQIWNTTFSNIATCTADTEACKDMDTIELLEGLVSTLDTGCNYNDKTGSIGSLVPIPAVDASGSSTYLSNISVATAILVGFMMV